MAGDEFRVEFILSILAFASGEFKHRFLDKRKKPRQATSMLARRFSAQGDLRSRGVHSAIRRHCER